MRKLSRNCGTFLILGLVALAVVIGVPTLFFVLNWLETPPVPTIDGPESDVVRAGVRCTLVYTNDSAATTRKLTILELPAGTSRSLHLEHDATSFSALARNGQMAYCRLERGRLDLWLKDTVGGEETCLVTREGPIADAAVSISPDGAHLALLTSEERDTGSTLPGLLEVLNLEAEVLNVVNGCWVPRGAHWLPDGNRFAVETTLGVVVASLDEGILRSMPALHSPITGASSSRVLCADWYLDSNSKAPLYPLPPSRWFDMESGELLDAIELPGNLLGPLWFTETGLVLYGGLATTGTTPWWAREALHPYERMSRWTIKACDPATGEFATVAPGFRFWKVAVGLRP